MSVLREAITLLSDNHNLVLWTDSNKKRRGEVCPLSSGIEYSFVSMFCQEILRRISQDNPLDFHQIFFIPNLKAEAKVGYDLSTGHHGQNNRVRTMHKVINERYCDQPWTFRLNYSRNENGEFIGDYGHLIKLLAVDQEDLEQMGVLITPFLVINICYCIHDYRRMGTLCEQEQLTIPSYSSLLRTIIVNLRSLQQQMIHNGVDLFSDHFYFKVTRFPEKRLQNETSQDYIIRIENKTNIRIECCGENIVAQNVILSFDEFFEQIEWDNFI